jgi:hypothetical protein
MRISESIERHARKAGRHLAHGARRAVHHAKSIRPRLPRISIAEHPFQVIAWGAAALVILCLVALYVRERNMVLGMDPHAPLACDELIFTANSERCAAIIIALYTDVPARERAYCAERERYGPAGSLCDAYEEALAEEEYGPIVREYGIAPWGVPPLEGDGTLAVHAQQPLDDAYLICDGNIVQTTFTRNDLGGILTFSPVKGACMLIGKVQGGSMQSSTFMLT